MRGIKFKKTRIRASQLHQNSFNRNKLPSKITPAKASSKGKFGLLKRLGPPSRTVFISDKMAMERISSSFGIKLSDINSIQFLFYEKAKPLVKIDLKNKKGRHNFLLFTEKFIPRDIFNEMLKWQRFMNAKNHEKE